VHVANKKEPGQFRFTIDYRALNEATQAKSWTIPNIELMLQRLAEKRPRYFAVMELTPGYFQAPIHPDSSSYTAFRTQRGTYEWKRVPMGLKYSGAYFQAQMTKILGPQLYNGVEVYLDDVVAIGATEEEYLTNLRTLLRRLAKAGGRRSPRKCKFGLRQVEYVGHVINEHGRTFSDDKKHRATDFPKPLLQKHMKSFLGLAFPKTHKRPLSHNGTPPKDGTSLQQGQTTRLDTGN
jgi:hypothetical protein